MDTGAFNKWKTQLDKWCKKTNESCIDWEPSREKAFKAKLQLTEKLNDDRSGPYNTVMIEAGNSYARLDNLADARLAYVYALRNPNHPLALEQRWKTLAALADVEYRAKNYARSASYYGDAGLWTISTHRLKKADDLRRSQMYKFAADAYRSLIATGKQCSVERGGFSSTFKAPNLDEALRSYNTLVAAAEYRTLTIVWFTIGALAFESGLFNDAKVAYTLAFKGLRADYSYRVWFNKLLGDVAYVNNEFETAANYYLAGPLPFESRRAEIKLLQKTAKTADNFMEVAKS